MNKKTLILMLLTATFLMVGLILFKQKFSLLGDCGTQVISNIVSMDRAIETSLVDCGATTDYSTRIMLNDLTKETSSKVMVLDGDHTSDLKVEWLTTSKVRISYRGGLQDAFDFREKVDDVNFELNPFPALSTQVIGVKEKVELINAEKKYEVKTLNNEEFLGHMTDGGSELVGYYKNGRIEKITEWVGLSYGVKTREYYLSNNKLILVHEKEEYFPSDNEGTLDYTKLSVAFEGHYYFDQEKIIYKQTSGKKRYPDKEGNMEQSFLAAVKKNIQLLSN